MTARRLELYGSRSCPPTADLREHLEWRNESFVEYDVEADSEAFRRLQELTPRPLAIPVLVENAMVTTAGWEGRSCFVADPRLQQPDES
jgi:glutaredoxin 3